MGFVRLTITAKLGLAFVGFSASLLVATLLLARWSFVSGFVDYVNGLEQSRIDGVAGQMSAFYLGTSTWPEGAEGHFFRAALRPPPHRREAADHLPPPHRREAADHLPPPAARSDRHHSESPLPMGPPPTALVDLKGRRVAGAEPRDFPVERLSSPVLVAGEVVAYVQTPVRQQMSRPLEAAFSKRQLESMVVSGVASMLLAVLLAAALARGMLAPVQRLISGVAQLAKGNYAVRLREPRQDELGDLLADFDALAETLGQTRGARQRMFADISHELRTPLAVLTAEIEAVRDGVRKFDEASLESLAEEVARLRRLVDDLYELATSDIGMLRYDFQLHDLREILSETIESLLGRNDGIKLTTRLDSVRLEVDRGRMDQLFRNVLGNSLAYTDLPGRIEIELTSRDGFVEAVVRDSAPAIPEDLCEQIFDPLYRVEGSRSRRTAGAGLGLAISRAIAEAHGGKLEARASSMGGVEVKLTLPDPRRS